MKRTNKASWVDIVGAGSFQGRRVVRIKSELKSYKVRVIPIKKKRNLFTAVKRTTHAQSPQNVATKNRDKCGKFHFN